MNDSDSLLDKLQVPLANLKPKPGPTPYFEGQKVLAISRFMMRITEVIIRAVGVTHIPTSLRPPAGKPVYQQPYLAV